jgi:hypothetical protein
VCHLIVNSLSRFVRRKPGCHWSSGTFASRMAGSCGCCTITALSFVPAALLSVLADKTFRRETKECCAPLRTNYVFFIRHLRIFALNGLECVIPGNIPALGSKIRGLDMFLKNVMMLLCAAGIAFYLRFLVALWKERKPRSSGYWVRLRLGSVDGTIAELPERRKPVRRAA